MGLLLYYVTRCSLTKPQETTEIQAFYPRALNTKRFIMYPSANTKSWYGHLRDKQEKKSCELR